MASIMEKHLIRASDLDVMHPLDSIKMTIARRRLSSTKISEGSEDALEVWIHNKIRKEFRASKELRDAIGRSELDVIERKERKGISAA